MTDQKEFEDCRAAANLLVMAIHTNTKFSAMMLDRAKQKFSERGRGYFCFEFKSQGSCLEYAKNVFSNTDGPFLLALMYCYDPECGNDPELAEQVKLYDPTSEYCVLVRINLTKTSPAADLAQFGGRLKPKPNAAAGFITVPVYSQKGENK